MKTKKAPQLSAIYQKYGILIVLLLIFIVVSFLTDKFLTPSNLLSVARQVSINGILSIGMCFVILTGGIDLSVGSLYALTATCACGLATHMPWQLAAILGVLIGIGIGLLEGTVIAKIKIAPFITTLASMTICRGITQVYDGGTAISTPGSGFNWLGTGYFGPIPVPVVLMVLLFAIAWFVLNRTKFGRHVYAVGGNERAAVLSGINAARVKIIVYAVSGFCCAISGYISAGRLSSATPTAGEGFEMDAIAAVVLGGVSMDGGRGSIIGVFVGAFIIGVLNNAMNLLSVTAYWQDIVKGCVILAAVFVDRALSKSTKE